MTQSDDTGPEQPSHRRALVRRAHPLVSTRVNMSNTPAAATPKTAARALRGVTYSVGTGAAKGPAEG